MAYAPPRSELQWPYRLQAGSQALLGKAMAPGAPWTRIGYGGPKGGGKSYGARAIAFDLTWRIPIVVVIVRSRLVTLKRNHIIPAKNELREFLAAGYIKYSEQDKIFSMPSGGMVMFMHCQTVADIAQFDGIPGDIYIFEEAGHFNEETMKGIYKNCRSSDIAINRNADYQPRVLFTFNWGGPGHSVLRRWFWDKVFHGKERADQFLFIFAPLDQNKALIERDPNYRQTLEELPPQLRDAYLKGDPDAFVGTMFTVIPDYHEVDPMVLLEPYNIGKPLADWRIPSHWALYGSLDAGVGAPCSFGLYAKTPEGQLFKIFNYYWNPKEDGKRNAPEHVAAICDLIESCPWTLGRFPEFIVSDTYAFQTHNQMGIEAGDITWEDLFNERGYALWEVKYNRVTAIMGLQTALHFELSDDNTSIEVWPKIRFFRGACEPTLQELRAAERSDKNPELIKDDAADHAIDETKNLILTAMNPPDLVQMGTGKKKTDPKADYGSSRPGQPLGYQRNEVESYREAY